MFKYQEGIPNSHSQTTNQIYCHPPSPTISSGELPVAERDLEVLRRPDACEQHGSEDDCLPWPES